MGDRADNINIRDNVLKITTKNSRLAKFRFNKLIIFDDQGVHGLPPIKERKVGLLSAIEIKLENTLQSIELAEKIIQLGLVTITYF